MTGVPIISDVTQTRRSNQIFHKTSLCRYQNGGYCLQGDSCTHAHSKSELIQKPDFCNTRFCSIFLRTGNCHNVKCNFAHSEEELVGANKKYRTKMCNFYLSGNCRSGNICRFLHDGAPRTVNIIEDEKRKVLTNSHPVEYKSETYAIEENSNVVHPSSPEVSKYESERHLQFQGGDHRYPLGSIQYDGVNCYCCPRDAMDSQLSGIDNRQLTITEDLNPQGKYGMMSYSKGVVPISSVPQMIMNTHSDWNQHRIPTEREYFTSCHMEPIYGHQVCYPATRTIPLVYPLYLTRPATYRISVPVVETGSARYSTTGDGTFFPTIYPNNYTP